jgi:transposase
MEINTRKKDHLVRSDQVAEWLGYSVRTITHWAEQWHDTGGQEGMPGFKVGRAWRFDTAELQRWLDAKKIPYQPIGIAKSG